MLNRAERRRLEKKGKLEKGDLKHITETISYNATNDAFRLFISMAVFALRDEFGFGETRVNRFIDSVNRKINEFNDGCFSIDDMEKLMKLEIGYEDKKIMKLRRSVG